ncbi:LysR family transcriptional regulator [Mesorhizobium sp. WSM4307]|uniref:LysR substrate-binding domain-containing protein n=1 Tax=unclassified Mesorhizobium TaxID=325217 RepID=UPI000BAF4692|nr:MULTISPECIES: LysR substrate-binding domain-containing protein [unclassified Mesorhizobium]PBB22317.1 LysR family transcriptional regulator [Mesorhizobium sp. WSM4304]PBB74723.1 LysR family transcriptional regulator [Mesorhizobium sp. WSM4308]TRC73098.1 LysR family transcriptional regulator [Mesorhizobium sp. WSM4315]TRC83386.1 LysR family transcriptional regulator [Mesorhizobium sp. WSM4307]
MQLPPLGTLKAFEAAARLESLTNASREMNVTHSAVSQQVRQLEEWLGRPLFRRAGRGIVLTPAGAEFYEAVSTALRMVSASSRRLKRNAGRSTLSVGCIPSIATRWLVPSVQDFLRKHPEIDMRVEYAHAQEAFDPDKHDVLITLSRADSEGYRSIRLFSRMNKPVASAHYVKQKPQVLQSNGLVGADLLHDESLDGWTQWFEKAGMKRVKPLRGPIYQDFNLLTGAIMAGHGVALCPIQVFRREIAQGDLVVLSEIATLEDQGYYLLRGHDADPAVDEFTGWFRQVCGSADDGPSA